MELDPILQSILMAPVFVLGVFLAMWVAGRMQSRDQHDQS